MRTTKPLHHAGLAITVLLACTAGLAGAQTTPSGQVVSPGTQGHRTGATPCSGPETTATTTNANDANCIEAGPGFVSPSLDAPPPAGTRGVVAFVRVGSVVPRPPVAMPDGDTFSVVGGATLIRVRRAELKDCLATGRRISARVNAPTSTTCLDRKGELLAYEECRSGSADCEVSTPQDIAKQQEVAKPQGSIKP